MRGAGDGTPVVSGMPSLRRWFVQMVACVLVLCTGACEREVTHAELAGVYAISRGAPADTLRLFADGRWVRTFAEPNTQATVDSGPWFLSRDAQTVGLRQFPQRRFWGHDVMFDTTQGRVFATPATVALRIRRAPLRKLRLDWKPEFGWTYARSEQRE